MPPSSLATTFSGDTYWRKFSEFGAQNTEAHAVVHAPPFI